MFPAPFDTESGGGRQKKEEKSSIPERLKPVPGRCQEKV